MRLKYYDKMPDLNKCYEYTEKRDEFKNDQTQSIFNWIIKILS